MANNYTAVPHEYLEEFEVLTDAEFGRLLRGLLRYSRDGVAIEASGNERFYVRRVMTQEDVNAQHYAASAQRRHELALRGAEARWHGRSDAGACPGIKTDAGDAGTEQYRAVQARIEQIRAEQRNKV